MENAGSISSSTYFKPLEHVSHSSRQLFKSCQYAWVNRYVRKLESKYRSQKALWFGSGIHLALESHYGPNDTDIVDVWRQYVADTGHAIPDSDVEEMLPMGEHVLREYRDFYANENIEVIACEWEFKVKIPYQEYVKNDDGTITTRKSSVEMVGFVDLVYRDLANGRVYAMEHKTASSLGVDKNHFVNLDEQATTYATMLTYSLRKSGIIKPDEWVTGVVYNYLKKQQPDSRPRNPQGLYCNKPLKKHYQAALTKAGIEFEIRDSIDTLKALADSAGIPEVFGDPASVQPELPFMRITAMRYPAIIKNHLKRMQEELSLMSAVSMGIFPATKRITRDCAWCEFRDICVSEENDGDTKNIISMMYREREDRREASRENSNNDPVSSKD